MLWQVCLLSSFKSVEVYLLFRKKLRFSYIILWRSNDTKGCVQVSHEIMLSLNPFLVLMTYLFTSTKHQEVETKLGPNNIDPFLIRFWYFSKIILPSQMNNWIMTNYFKNYFALFFIWFFSFIDLLFPSFLLSYLSFDFLSKMFY